MDPYGADGELVNIHTAFHQAEYQKVIDFDVTPFSASNELPARLLKLRAYCALSQHDAAIKSISDAEAKSTPDLAAAKLFAQYLKASHAGGSAGKVETLVQQAETLADKQADNLSVQVFIGSLLAAAGKTDEALALLKHHQGSLDAAALVVQIQLLLNRQDLAAKQARAARGFAQDALLVNLCEAWLWMRQGGKQYQQAFYVFEDLAQQAKSSQYLNAQAVSEIHLGRLEEADTGLKAALDADPGNVDAVANRIAWSAISGKGHAELSQGLDNLKAIDASHALLQDLTLKREAFAAAAAKYAPRFE